ncbi:MAG: CBS domain-containing protein [Candidatus Methanoplasma sp.]|jgi:CBS domain-containing protein|nr:CBS domain-containing protein [Candidatus Methanoplasma sp.]
MKELRVRDLMTTQVVTVKPTDTIRRATIKFAVDSVTGAPVVDNRNHVIGIITEHDILELILRHQDRLDAEGSPNYLLASTLDGENLDAEIADANRAISEMKVEDVMKRSVLVTTPDAEIVETLREMMKMGVNRVPVLEQGVLVGVITRADIIFHIYKRKA